MQERKALEKEMEEGPDGGGKEDESWFALGDSDETYKWTVTVMGPQEYAVNPVAEDEAAGKRRPSPYADGMFQVQFDFQASYPMTPPKVRFLSPVYHPNVKLSGEHAGSMCAEFVSKEWKPSETVRSVLEKIVALLASPNMDDPLEAPIGAEMRDDLPAFEAKAREYVERHCK